jgi:hypothetical protein
MTDYRATALAWVAEPDHRPAVEAIAKHLHANESIHLHDRSEGSEPCSYCWLRAAKAVQAIERGGHRVSPNEQFDNIREDRDRVRQENERLRELIAVAVKAARVRAAYLLDLRDNAKNPKRTMTRGHAWEVAAHEVRKIADLLEGREG